MSKGAAARNELVAFIFNGDALSWQNTKTLYVALHTADPTMAGQDDREAKYPGYQRMAVPRTRAGWSVDEEGVAFNRVDVVFPQCSGGKEVITHFSIGVAKDGIGKILYRGELARPLLVSDLITPRFPTGAIEIEEV